MDPCRRLWWLCIVLFSVTAALPPALGQDKTDGDQPLTKEEFAKFLKEYERFKAEYATVRNQNESLRSELEGLKTELTALKAGGILMGSESAFAEERAEILREVRKEFSQHIGPLLPGLTNFTISGAAVTAFVDREDADSTFAVGLAPVLLWKPTDKLLFETEVAFGLTDDETEVELDYAQFSYLLNDYVTIAAGKFLLPFGTFWERWHPSWINKLPTMPLVYERQLVGSAGLGFQLRGGAALGSTKINYAVYYINGPDFRSNQIAAGRLGFANQIDNNNNKSFGARVGFLPIPELEIGYSFLTGEVGDSGSFFRGVDTFIQGVDFSYAREFDAIKGRLDLRAEGVWVDTDNVIFIGPFDPFTFDNKRNGWFMQAAYRPTMLDIKLSDGVNLRDLEFVARY
ncbi:MAG: hypothetical protein IID38_05075, partial [Planctomycetes bacterium]|nr:hypothetical protein [Planctomycetota bacterium]